MKRAALVSIKVVDHREYNRCMTWWRGGQRHRKYYTVTSKTEEKELKRLAGEKEVELANQGRQHGELTEDERAAVIEARELIAEYAPHRVDFTLADIVQFYRGHLQTKRTSVPLLTAYDDFLLTKERDGTGSRHLTDIRQRLKPFCERHRRKLVAEIGTEDIDIWLTGLKVAPQTRLNHRRILNNFFTYCSSRGYAALNPVTLASKVKVKGKPPGILTVQQTASLVESCPVEILAAVAIGAFAGLRREEIARLDWAEVNLGRGFIEVKADKAKTASRRLVKIEPNLANLLAPLAKDAGPLRPSEMIYRTHLDTARTAAKIDSWPSNALRHSFASYHLARGENASQTALQLGHADTGILFEHYRELVAKEDGDSYFKIGLPAEEEDEPQSDKIIPIKGVAA
jgi:integrase